MSGTPATPIGAAAASALLLGIDVAEATGSPVIQLAYTVEDIDRAARWWAAAAGAGPFFRIGRGPLRLRATEHAGEPAEWHHSTSIGQWGRVMVELSEQHAASPPSLAAAMGVGVVGFNHVAWMVDDLDAEGERLQRLGFPQVLAATNGAQDFRFHDATATLGHRIEFYLPLPEVVTTFVAVQHAARGWDGSDPVRPMSALRPYMEGAARAVAAASGS